MSETRDRGLTLFDAAQAYASQLADEAVIDAEQKIPTIDVEKFNAIKTTSSKLNYTISYVAEAVAARSALEDAKTIKKRELLASLCSGDLVAIGVRTKPVVDQQETQIRASWFDGAIIDWVSSAIEKAGNRFEAIRVFKTVTLPPDQKTSSKLFGRPSNKPIIENILDEMARSGWNLSRNQKDSRAEIRKLAKSRGIDITRGYSDPVLNVAIRRVRDQPMED